MAFCRFKWGVRVDGEGECAVEVDAEGGVDAGEEPQKVLRQQPFETVHEFFLSSSEKPQRMLKAAEAEPPHIADLEEATQRAF